MKMSGENYYIVHGAKMCCTCGSNSTRINLPTCHGVYTRDKAFMNEGDCVFEKNISMFGICQVGEGETVGFVSDLNVEGFCQEGEPVFGPACKPTLASNWEGTHSVTKIDGKPALTLESHLPCHTGAGGDIWFMTNGQEEA